MTRDEIVERAWQRMLADRAAKHAANHDYQPPRVYGGIEDFREALRHSDSPASPEDRPTFRDEWEPLQSDAVRIFAAVGILALAVAFWGSLLGVLWRLMR